MELSPRIHKQSLINNVIATAGDIDLTSMPGFIAITGLNPIPAAASKLSVVKTASAAEVRQYVTFTMPTIAINTLYSVQGAEAQAQDINKNMNKFKPYKWTMDPVLGVDALTDKVKVAYVIGWKIRQDAAAGTINVVAGPEAIFTHASATYVVGDVITGITSGATGVIASITSATVALIIMTSSNDFTDTEAVKLNGTTTAITVTSNVYTGKLGILDDAGYYPARGNRKGASSWALGSNISTMTVVRAGSRSFGIGSRLLDEVPILDNHSPNLHSGDFYFATNNPPVSGNTYSRYVIVNTFDENIASSLNVNSSFEGAQALWVNEGASNFAALDTALLAL